MSVYVCLSIHLSTCLSSGCAYLCLAVWLCLAGWLAVYLGRSLGRLINYLLKMCISKVYRYISQGVKINVMYGIQIYIQGVPVYIQGRRYTSKGVKINVMYTDIYPRCIQGISKVYVPRYMKINIRYTGVYDI